MTCKISHDKVVLDKFMQLPGVHRLMPGNCYCLVCKEPIPYMWNNGNPVKVEQEVRDAPGSDRLRN